MNSSANHLGNPLVTAGITRIGKNQNQHYDSPLNSSANCRRRSLHPGYYSDLTTTTMTKTMTTTTNDVCLKRSYNNDNSNNNDNNNDSENNNTISTTSPMHGRTSSWSMLPPYVPSGNSSRISMPVLSADLSIHKNSFHRLGLPSQYPDRLDQSSSNSSFESVLLEELEDFDDIFGRPSSSES